MGKSGQVESGRIRIAGAVNLDTVSGRKGKKNAVIYVGEH